MTCLSCNGDGWVRREKDVSAIYGKPMTVTVTKPCRFCNCTGRVKAYVPCGKDKAADREENTNHELL